MKDYKKRLGDYGEKIARKYLVGKNYRIIEQNYHSSEGEVDIIALDDQNGLAFIEVKTRTSTTFGDPIDAVDQGKLIKLLKTVDYFLDSNPLFDCYNSRIDFIGIKVDLALKQAELEHIKDVAVDIEY